MVWIHNRKCPGQTVRPIARPESAALTRRAANQKCVGIGRIGHVTRLIEMLDAILACSLLLQWGDALQVAEVLVILAVAPGQGLTILYFEEA